MVDRSECGSTTCDAHYGNWSDCNTGADAQWGAWPIGDTHAATAETPNLGRRRLTAPGKIRRPSQLYPAPGRSGIRYISC